MHWSAGLDDSWGLWRPFLPLLTLCSDLGLFHRSAQQILSVGLAHEKCWLMKQSIWWNETPNYNWAAAECEIPTALNFLPPALSEDGIAVRLADSDLTDFFLRLLSVHIYALDVFAWPYVPYFSNLILRARLFGWAWRSKYRSLTCSLINQSMGKSKWSKGGGEGGGGGDPPFSSHQIDNSLTAPKEFTSPIYFALSHTDTRLI